MCATVKLIAERLKGRKIDELFADMGKTWDSLVADPQLRWIGPEKGVVSIATGAVSNAIWDLYARKEKKPLWKVSTHLGSISFCSHAWTDASYYSLSLPSSLPTSRPRSLSGLRASGTSPTPSRRRRRSPCSRPRRPARQSVKSRSFRLDTRPTRRRSDGSGTTTRRSEG